MHRPILSFLAATAMASGAPLSIPLTGTGASETDGDGYAFVIPNLDGTTVNPDGSVNYNPLTFPVPPFDPTIATPTNQIPSPGPNEVFNIGNVVYESTAITGIGTEYLPVTPCTRRPNTPFVPCMPCAVVFNFQYYDYAFGYELDVRPPTFGKSIVVLSNITGPGLKFVDGVPKRLDFTARVSWYPTLSDATDTLDQTYTPYTGTLTVVNGTFTFDLSDVPARWTLGTGDVYFRFDLVATIPSLAEVAPPPPRLEITPAADGQLSLNVLFDSPSTERYILQTSETLTGWQNLGTDFTQAAPPAPRLVTPTPPRGFFRISKFPP